jgi:uncharacterized protein YndB with AHSA1/START domain
MPRGFIQIDTEIAIDRSPAHVFAYATTPALWQTWHPATVAVRNVPDRPLVVGETAREVIDMAGRSDEALWTVTQCEPPRLWQIATETAKGVARITYQVDARGDGCLFRRTLEFRSKGWPWPLFDATLTRLFLVVQSRRALRNLQRVLA